MATKSIFEIGTTNLVKSAKSSKTIYKKEIFAECKTDKEKKHLRIKLRRHLKNFIASAFTYQQTKQNEKLQALKKDWKEYAKAVYQNAEIIVDGNASEDFAKDCKNFLQVMSNK